MDDGADIIDCSVQMSKDGVAFCLNSADLMGDTTAMTAFISRSTTVPEIQQKSGIFSFDLTWSEIQGLKRKRFLQLCSSYFLCCKEVYIRNGFSGSLIAVNEWLTK